MLFTSIGLFNLFDNLEKYAFYYHHFTDEDGEAMRQLAQQRAALLHNSGDANHL